MLKDIFGSLGFVIVGSDILFWAYFFKLKVYAGNCIAQLNVNPKDPSESFFDVYDKDETKLIYGIEIGILKEMFGI